MRRLAFAAVALLSSLAARADPPGVSLRLRSAPPRAITAAPAQQTCAAPVLDKVGWIDPSDGLALLASPTARLDEYEAHSIALAPLVNLRLGLGGATLFVLGAPARTGAQLTQAGWRPRWPFC